MGLGGLFRKQGPSIQQQTADKITAANQQIIAAQGVANAASVAARPAIASGIDKKIADVVSAGPTGAALLGLQDIIKTSSQGLRNGKVNSGKLAILGN